MLVWIYTKLDGNWLIRNQAAHRRHQFIFCYRCFSHNLFYGTVPLRQSFSSKSFPMDQLYFKMVILYLQDFPFKAAFFTPPPLGHMKKEKLKRGFYHFYIRFLICHLQKITHIRSGFHKLGYFENLVKMCLNNTIQRYIKKQMTPWKTTLNLSIIGKYNFKLWLYT